MGIFSTFLLELRSKDEIQGDGQGQGQAGGLMAGKGFSEAWEGFGLMNKLSCTCSWTRI